MYFCIEVMCFIFYYFFPFSILSYFIFLFQLRKLIYQDCEQHVGAGINALMSISDGVGPSIFCRKMEIPARVSIFNFDVLMSEVFFPICTLTWRVNNYVSRQGKV